MHARAATPGLVQMGALRRVLVAGPRQVLYAVAVSFRQPLPNSAPQKTCRNIRGSLIATASCSKKRVSRFSRRPSKRFIRRPQVKILVEGLSEKPPTDAPRPDICGVTTIVAKLFTSSSPTPRLRAADGAASPDPRMVKDLNSHRNCRLPHRSRIRWSGHEFPQRVPESRRARPSAGAAAFKRRCSRNFKRERIAARSPPPKRSLHASRRSCLIISRSSIRIRSIPLNGSRKRHWSRLPPMPDPRA